MIQTYYITGLVLNKIITFFYVYCNLRLTSIPTSMISVERHFAVGKRLQTKCHLPSQGIFRAAEARDTDVLSAAKIITIMMPPPLTLRLGFERKHQSNLSPLLLADVTAAVVLGLPSERDELDSKTPFLPSLFFETHSNLASQHRVA